MRLLLQQLHMADSCALAAGMQGLVAVRQGGLVASRRAAFTLAPALVTRMEVRWFMCIACLVNCMVNCMKLDFHKLTFGKNSLVL